MLTARTRTSQGRAGFLRRTVVWSLTASLVSPGFVFAQHPLPVYTPTHEDADAVHAVLNARQICPALDCPQGGMPAPDCSGCLGSDDFWTGALSPVVLAGYLARPLPPDGVANHRVTGVYLNVGRRGVSCCG
jgi:hypothetical protein